MSNENSNGAANGAPSTRRSNIAEIVSVCSRFRDHFDDLVGFAYRIYPFKGIRRAAALRVLAERLEALVPLMTDLIPVIRAEAMEAEKGSKSGG